jgi:hypothetical protein
MPQLPNMLLLERKERLQLALEAYNSGQFHSHWVATQAFNVKCCTFSLIAPKGCPFAQKPPSTARSLLQLKSK